MTKKNIKSLERFTRNFQLKHAGGEANMSAIQRLETLLL
jgi:hypothetical protein